MTTTSRFPTNALSFFLLLSLFAALAMMVDEAEASWQWYRSCLSSKPLLTKSATATALLTLSDAVCQQIEMAAAAKKTKKQQQLASVAVDGSSSSSEGLPPPAVPAVAHPLHHNWKRTRDVAVTGFIWSAPISHVWFNFVEAVVKVNHPVWGLICRLALDSAIFSPLVGT